MIEGMKTGQCWVCGKKAIEWCDYDYHRQPREQQCGRGLCVDHVIVEAQLGDTHGADGVDMRCAEHTARVGTVKVV